ncbi:hypothetical protein [Naasia lichenicola]|uniref:Uncharacterized protein n=1 Tax=Naasia lichenicola TaxID=2565933 RepID=A0A4S4FJY4_9MICO|nr:hypothetical protein [Naasia lichenicola]THG30680.1 hypothetical protein E6C64_08550 [Naasia lichenicola]THG31917.1 hypothetical protein E6C64_07695 [Naasia lichenicola]
MSETTTPEPVETPPADPAQGIETTDPTAVPTTTEPINDPSEDEGDAPADPAQGAATEEDDPAAYWLKKGIDISTPEGLAKATKSYREAEQAMTKKSQEASELARKLTSATPAPEGASEATEALHIARNLQNANTINTWKAEKGVTAEEDQAMGQYVQDNPDIAELLTGGKLSLDQLRTLASAATPVDTAAIKKQGGHEALTTLANKQRTTPVSGNAASGKTPERDPIMEALLADD